MAYQWYITFHGGEGKDEWNNIHAFDHTGAQLGKRLDHESLPHHIALRELRGFAFGPDGDLYVANAYRNASQVLRFAGSLDGNGRHAFREVFISLDHANPGLAHPFDVTFSSKQHLFVPSQDTNVVGRYYGPRPGEGTPGAPMPYPPALSAHHHTLPPGTFVPSNHHASHGLRAVRGTVFGSDHNLYVADRDTNSVKAFHGETGSLIKEYTHASLAKPVHLHAAGKNRILVGSRDNNAILAIDVERGAIDVLVQPNAGGLKGPSGMALTSDGKLYVCSRESKQVLRFDAVTGAPDAEPFIDRLPDYPEFIVQVSQP